VRPRQAWHLQRRQANVRPTCHPKLCPPKPAELHGCVNISSARPIASAYMSPREADLKSNPKLLAGMAAVVDF